MTLVGMSGRVGALAPARHARRVRLPEAFFPPGERGLFSTVRPKTLKKKRIMVVVRALLGTCTDMSLRMEAPAHAV